MTERELNERMERLSRRQRVCLSIQALLAALTVIFYQCAILLLPAHMVVVLIPGGILSNKATRLARQKYPYVSLRTAFLGRGTGWDPYIIDEAKRLHDGLTVRVLSFGRRTIYCFLAAALGAALMWCFAAFFRSGPWGGA